MKLFIATVLLLCLANVSLVSSIKCYTLSCTRSDTYCTENMTPEQEVKLNQTECDTPCLKKVTRRLDGTLHHLQRKCLADDKGNDRDRLIGCSTVTNDRSGQYEVTIDYCVCHGNLCNGALPTNHVSSVILLGATLVAAFIGRAVL